MRPLCPLWGIGALWDVGPLWGHGDPFGVMVTPLGYRCPMGHGAPIWGNGDPIGVSVPYGTWGPFGVMVIHLG